MSVKCANCKDHHSTVYAVKVCHAISRRIEAAPRTRVLSAPDIFTDVGTLDWSGPNEDWYGEE